MGGKHGTTFHWGEAVGLLRRSEPLVVQVVFDDADVSSWIASSKLMWADSSGIVRKPFDEALEDGDVRIFANFFTGQVDS